MKRGRELANINENEVGTFFKIYIFVRGCFILPDTFVIL